MAQRILGKRLAVESDRAGSRVVEAQRQLDDGGLAGAARSHDGHPPPRRYCEADVAQDGLLLAPVRKTDAVERQRERTLPTARSRGGSLLICTCPQRGFSSYHPRGAFYDVWIAPPRDQPVPEVVE